MFRGYVMKIISIQSVLSKENTDDYSIKKFISKTKYNHLEYYRGD